MRLEHCAKDAASAGGHRAGRRPAVTAFIAAARSPAPAELARLANRRHAKAIGCSRCGAMIRSMHSPQRRDVAGKEPARSPSWSASQPRH